jgi:hypothetical protein
LLRQVDARCERALAHPIDEIGPGSDAHFEHPLSSAVRKPGKLVDVRFPRVTLALELVEECASIAIRDPPRAARDGLPKLTNVLLEIHLIHGQRAVAVYVSSRLVATRVPRETTSLMVAGRSSG